MHEKARTPVKYAVETTDGPLELVVLTYRPRRLCVVAPGFEACGFWPSDR